MAIRIPTISVDSDTNQELIPKIDGGVSYKYAESQLKKNQSPYMVNMNADDNGALAIRKGQTNVYETSLGAGGILSAFERPFNGYRIFQRDTKIYKQSDGYQPTEIFSGLTAAKGRFFSYNDNVHHIGNGHYVQYNGTTAQEVVGYIPTLTLGRAPAGGGTAYEERNLIQPGFKDSFSADGAATVYNLSLKALDATAVTIKIGTTDKTENTHFTVDRTNGTINFAGGSSPNGAPTAGTNNVVITAYKTEPDNIAMIKNCTCAKTYDNVVFISGNPDYPNRYWYTNIVPTREASYYPEYNYNDVGADNELIYGFGEQYDKLIILKEHSTIRIEITVDSQGNKVYAPKTLNPVIGCDMPYTIQEIKNNLVWCNSYAGVHMLVSTDVKDEQNVIPLSGNINGSIYRPGLLDEAAEYLANAVSADFEGKYWLILPNNGKAWVWDYKKLYDINDDETLAWFPYNNIYGNCCIIDNKKLILGHTTEGRLTTFINTDNDFGENIQTIVRSKLFDFGLFDWLKTVSDIRFNTRANTNSTIDIKYYSDKDGEILGSKTIPANETASFDWDNFDWDNFTWDVSKYYPTIHLQPKLKKIQYFQIEFINIRSILNMIIEWTEDKEIK